MLKSLNKTWLRLACAGMVGISVANQAAAQEAENSFIEQFNVLVAEDGDDVKGSNKHSRFVLKMNADEESMPKVWVGVMLKEIEGDLADYLGDVSGVLIGEVMDDSPAKEAGVKKGDVLVKVNSKAVKTTAELMEMLGKAKEGDVLKMNFLRSGKPVNLKVKPTERPEQFSATFIPEDLDLSLDVEANAELGRVLELLQNSKEGEDGVNVFRLGGPSLRLKSANSKINRQGVIQRDVDGEKIEIRVDAEDGEAAKITVTKDGKVTKYDGSEELPDDISVMVKPMLEGKNGARFEVRSMPMIVEALSDDLDSGEMSKKIQELIQKHSGKLHGGMKVAEKAREAAERVRVRIEKSDGKSEIDELRALVEKLTHEVKQLREELDEDED